MAAYASPALRTFCELPRLPVPLTAPNAKRSVRVATSQGRPRLALVRCSENATLTSPSNLTPAITLSERARTHLLKMKNDTNKNLFLRIGVRQGGCSGYSYVMDFEDPSNIQEGDSIINHDDISMVCDPKSLLFLYGLQLDYSDALIGGGFSFQNPNAATTCGCGKSFSA